MERTVRFGYFCSVSIPYGPCCIKQISQSQSIRTLAYLFYTIGSMGCSPRNRKSRLTANHWDDRRNSSPPDFGRDGKGRQREKRSRMFVRLWQENILCQQHKSKTARNCEMLDWYVLLCQNVMKFLRELCLCIRQSLRFLCSIWRITHSYEFYSNCA